MKDLLLKKDYADYGLLRVIRVLRDESYVDKRLRYRPTNSYFQVMVRDTGEVLAYLTPYIDSTRLEIPYIQVLMYRRESAFIPGALVVDCSVLRGQVFYCCSLNLQHPWYCQGLSFRQAQLQANRIGKYISPSDLDEHIENICKLQYPYHYGTMDVSATIQSN